MEKKSINGRDILRMDGLPPTRCLPVCNAVTSTEKKKDKKWSIGGILKRMSSLRDCDSSSNDEQIVYCTSQPRPCSVFNRKSNNVVLRPVEKDSYNIPGNSMNATSSQKDSLNSRNSDESLDRLSKKARQKKLKARIEAKRDRICADSSSDEDSRKSSNSLTRYQNESAQKNSSCNKKSRAARTERYIKRLSKEESYRFPENLSDLGSKRVNLQGRTHQEQLSIDTNESVQSSRQSPWFSCYSNSNTFPVQRSVENLRQSRMVSPSFQVRSSTDLTKYPNNQFITESNQTNTYAKPNVSRTRRNQEEVAYRNYNSYDYTTDSQFTSRSCIPPDPPPRDSRFRIFSYGCNSYPFNGKHMPVPYNDTLRTKMNDIHQVTKDLLKSLQSYESHNEINWYDPTRHYTQRPLSPTVSSSQPCNLSECTNNRHNSTGKHLDEMVSRETEAMKCRRRNDRNDQLTSSFKYHDTKTRENKLSKTVNNNSVSATSNTLESMPIKQEIAQDSFNLLNDVSTMNRENRLTENKEEEQEKSDQDVLEKKRTSKNLEEALTELEAIYNSLRLGDEDLLDRAERRSMEEFNLRQAKNNAISYISEDSIDRTKDDMAYRRMHPKERPASLSEMVSQSALSNISYLIASPILSRKNATDDYLYSANPVHRDEPDVTRDDVVYRSIHRANNTPKVIDPQPPFGIPLGPVTTATESDYLHTTPTKLDNPRSLYIPQCEPDIVTDDLAYRSLRKDANTSKITAKAKNDEEKIKDQETTFETKKKRAVRSHSANLYGLINYDRIHLRREPSLQEIKDEMSNTIVDIKSLTKLTDRRVVSDGELSDYDTRWRTNNLLRNTKTDINGNDYPVMNVHRKKLRVYVSPSAQNIEKKEKNLEKSTTSDDLLTKALNNEFWQDCDQSKLNEIESADTKFDFTTYSRLCQDLVDLIDEQTEPTLQSNLETEPILETSICSSDSNKTESSTLQIQSLGSHYSGNASEDYKECIEKEDVEELTKSLVNADCEKDVPEKTDDSTFDFYLRVADENVKLIAEAFSSVADHLRDSRLIVTQKNSSKASPRSEIETDSTAPSTSTRSSVAYSLDDTSNDFSNLSSTIDALTNTPLNEDATMILKEDNDSVEMEEIRSTNLSSIDVDAELDLMRAVHDLQLAAASLSEHEKEIEQLLTKDTSNDVSCSTNGLFKRNNTLSSDIKTNLLLQNDEKEKENNEEETVKSAVKSITDGPDSNSEGESSENIECKTRVTYDNLHSTEMCISYVINLATVLITTYSTVLLACFLALLLVFITAAS